MSTADSKILGNSTEVIADRVLVTAPALVAGALLVGVTFINEAVLRGSDAEQFSVDWQILLRLLMCGACGLYGLVFLPKTKDYLFSFPGILALLFGIWAIFTIPFAVNKVYAATATWAYLCILLFAPAVLTNLSSRWVLYCLIASMVIYLIGCWYYYYFVPNLGRATEKLPGAMTVERFGGLNHPNGTGRQAALAGVIFIIAIMKGYLRWWMFILLFGLALITLKATDSRTGMIAFIAASGVLFWHRSKSAVLSGVVLGVLGLCSILLLSNLGLLDLPGVSNLLSKFSRSGSAEEIYTMTGRNEIWGFVLNKLSSSWFFGFGHGCARFIMKDFVEMPTHHAHNLVLNVMLGGGVIAGILLLGMMFNLIASIFIRPSMLPDIIITLVVVGGIADPVMMNPIPDCNTVLFLIALFWRPMNMDRQEKHLVQNGGSAA